VSVANPRGLLTLKELEALDRLLDWWCSVRLHAPLDTADCASLHRAHAKIASRLRIYRGTVAATKEEERARREETP
jgi:hypothetical protein